MPFVATLCCCLNLSWNYKHNEESLERVEKRNIRHKRCLLANGGHFMPENLKESSQNLPLYSLSRGPSVFLFSLTDFYTILRVKPVN